MEVHASGVTGDEHGRVNPSGRIDSGASDPDVEHRHDGCEDAGRADHEQLDDGEHSADGECCRAGTEDGEPVAAQHIAVRAITGAPGPGRLRTPR